MLFLADENIHADLVAWLRSCGHDVSSASEFLAGESDESVLRRARDEGRILITDDKDFGELVVHRRLATAGVLLLRLRDPSVHRRIARLGTIWPTIESKLDGAFVVVSDRRVRVRSASPPGGGGRP
jgi:predicted nuclease of predicted toxin-antitoxin system